MRKFYTIFVKIKIKIKRIIIKFILIFIKNKENKMKIVYDFFSNYNGFRSLNSCVRETGLNYFLCLLIKEYLYEKRKLGLYYFEKKKPPQKYMEEYILKKFPTINSNSYILEIGPGDNSVFSPEKYKNWYGVDKYFDRNIIRFRDFNWGKKYPQRKIFQGTFENLSNVINLKDMHEKIDLIVSSHSYEHVFKPIESLKQVNKMLIKGGFLCFFVPDAFTDDQNTKDPTHTLYLVPEMIIEFFSYAGGFKDINIEPFRPNADIVITAIKE